MSTGTDSVCNERVFSRIFKEYSTRLFNYLFYTCGDEALAQDLTQDAFTKLWQKCAEVTRSTAEGWVFKTAKNALMNKFQRDKVRLKFESIERPQHTNVSPEYILEEKELKAQLEAAISALPEKQRVVFLMSRIDKMTYKEIAEKLEISKQAVEKRMYNALDALRLVSKNIR